MTDTPQLSGRDLARQALAAYKATARTQPSTPAKSVRKRTVRRGPGRDPVTLADAITALGADLPLDAGIAGGNLLDQWPALCPQYADRVHPVAYDEQRGRLDLRPGSHAYAAQLQLLGGQLAKQINDKLGRTVVRSIRVLPVGNVPQHDAYTAVYADPSETTQPEAPVKTRETASAGYRAALAAALAHKPPREPQNPYIAEAIRAQDAALRAKRLPESEDRDAYWAQRDAAEKTGPEPGSIDASIAAAIARKRQEQTGSEPRRLFGAA
ncbi:DciA family protein [Streptomyces leeuwenhoekii]|uniref:Sle1_036 protein n=1 Tax=Streptomyces leeuwenhoekii TaxID=1437453 RepID=A0A0F7VMC7_STRLW|nr:DciA family protein [Streptomyces leeuwenhoekii]CQR59203.1 sle1_036 [Streptomyces leeuwenhoekii]